MTNPEVTTPVAANPYLATTTTPPFDRWRWLLAGVIGILGGYLTIGAAIGGLLNALSGFGGFPPEFTALLVAQAVFAIAVTAFAYAVAPGSASRRILAIVIFALGVVGTVALMFGRIYAGLPIPGTISNFLINPFFLVLFFGALGWLLASGARPLAFVGLLLTLIVLPLNFVFLINGVGSGISTAVQYVLALVVAVVILLISRPARVAVPDTYVTPVVAPSAEAVELAPTAFVAMEEGAAVVEEPKA